MKKNILLLFVLFSACSNHLKAQEFKELCGAHELHQEKYNTDARYKSDFDNTQAFLAEQGITNYKTVVTTSGTEYHIPIVVHVIHTGGAVGSIYNPSATAIDAFVARINSGFSNLLDHASVPGTYNSVTVPFKFYLAKRNEATSCGTTTGINRYDYSSNATYVASGVRRATTDPGITDSLLKSLIHWNDLNYYNIYIVNKIKGLDGTVGSYTAGYANYPTLGGNDEEGMVVLATVSASTTSTTIIHELGHAFNLRHTFNGGSTSTCAPNTSCTTQGDFVCDTEPIYQSIPCGPSGTNPCTSVAYTGTQYNYLTYTSCRDRFTTGQKTRMESALSTIRTSYKNSAGMDAPPTSLPTTITAPTYTTANAGNTFNMGPMYVKLSGLEHTSKSYSFEAAGDVHYVDNTCNQATALVLGTSYPLSVKTVTNPQKAYVYIDFNNDGVFGTTAPELVMSSSSTSTTVTHTATVTPPLTAVLNTPLRMRVIADASSATITPTMTLLYGQAEDYTVTIIGGALPVVWRSISAALNANQNIDVRWSTEMEKNSERFELEKSKDGINFYRIATLKGRGNSDLPSYYSFEDKTNVNGYNYYRVKQIDIDGQSSYSKTVSEIISSQETDIVIFPNPTRGELYINLVGMQQHKNEIQYSITDLNGRVWAEDKLLINSTNSKITADMNSMPAGMYFVQVNINGKFSIQKVVKQ